MDTDMDLCSDDEADDSGDDDDDDDDADADGTGDGGNDDCFGDLTEGNNDSSASSSDPCQGYVSIKRSDDTNDFCETSNRNSRTIGGGVSNCIRFRSQLIVSVGSSCKRKG